MKREREERLQIMLTMDELRAVDDFRYKTRMPSRAAAVRELLNRGLRAIESGVASPQSRSKDFGVLDIANGSSFENAATGPATTPDAKSPKRIHD
jgi:hypothetical protein